VIDDADAHYPGDGATRGWRAINLSEWNGQDVDRTYQGLQLVLNKRYSNRWQGSSRSTTPTPTASTAGRRPELVHRRAADDGHAFGSSPNHFQNNSAGRR